VLIDDSDREAVFKAEIWLEAVQAGLRGDRMLNIVLDLEEALVTFRARLEGD